MNHGYGSTSRRWDSQSWSLILGSILGVRVRVHLAFLVFVIYYLLLGVKEGVFLFYLTLCGLFFVLVLLHEFGHCFGCRSVGGEADDILIWPLGGLATCQQPNRALENLITTLAGPAVNLAVLVGLLPLLAWFDVLSWSLWNPFRLGVFWDAAAPASYLVLAFKVNYWLLLFNLCLPIFPFDGGRVLQEILWFRMGSYHATMVATTVGMGGAVLLCGISLYYQNLLLAAIAGFAFLESLRVRKDTELRGPMVDNEFGYDFSQGYTSLERSMHSGPHTEVFPTLRRRLRAWLERRRQRNAARLEAELDRILEKIHEHGMHSLSREEKKTLSLASKKRKR